MQAGTIAVRRVKKDDMRRSTAAVILLLLDLLDQGMTSFCCCIRIAKVTGGQILLSLAGMDGDELFDSSLLGTAEKVKFVIASPLRFMKQLIFNIFVVISV